MPALKCLISLFMLWCGFYLFLREGIQKYRDWKLHHQKKMLSNAVFMFMFSIYFVSIVFIAWLMPWVMLNPAKIESAYIATALLATAWLSSYVLIPMIFQRFKDWKTHRKIKDLSIACFLAYLNVYMLAVLIMIGTRQLIWFICKDY